MNKRSIFQVIHTYNRSRCFYDVVFSSLLILVNNIPLFCCGVYYAYRAIDKLYTTHVLHHRNYRRSNRHIYCQISVSGNYVAHVLRLYDTEQRNFDYRNFAIARRELNSSVCPIQNYNVSDNSDLIVPVQTNTRTRRSNSLQCNSEIHVHKAQHTRQTFTLAGVVSDVSDDLSASWEAEMCIIAR